MNALTELTEQQLDDLVKIMRKNQLPGLAKLVFEAVEARGQFEGFETEGIAARQLCKLAEELGEAVEEIRLSEKPPDKMTLDGAITVWETGIIGAGDSANVAFNDRGDWWNDYEIDDLDAFATELADVAIPLLCLFWLMWDQHGIDIGGIIIDKVMKDIKRGVDG